MVYILGAGFSAPLGLPMMGDFWRKAREKGRVTPRIENLVKKVVERLDSTAGVHEYFEQERMNIEEALSMLEMSESFEGSGDMAVFKEFICEVIKCCTPDVKEDDTVKTASNWGDFLFGRQVLDRSYGFFVANLHCLDAVEHFYSDIHQTPVRYVIYGKRADASHSYSVVSFNYDMVLERYCDMMKTDREGARVMFGVDRQARAENSCCLAKVHGSVEGCRIICPTFLKGFNIRELPEEWRLAYELIKQANHIRIVGYSLPKTDAYMKYMLKAAVNESRQVDRIDIICRDGTGKVQRSYEEFVKFPYTRFAKGDFQEYMEKIYDHNRQTKATPTRKDVKMVRFDGLELAHEEFCMQKDVWGRSIQ